MRRFLAVARRYGVTTALVAGSGGFLWNDDALAQTAAEEEAKQKAAKHTGADFKSNMLEIK